MNIMLNAIDTTGDHPKWKDGDKKRCIDESSVRVTIHDNGHGIPSDKIKRIFEPFYTTRGPGRQTGGTGLGLSVCHRHLRQHGGEIFVDSKVGVGKPSRLYCRNPIFRNLENNIEFLVELKLGGTKFIA